MKINEITLEFQENSRRQLMHAEIFTMEVFLSSKIDLNTIEAMKGHRKA